MSKRRAQVVLLCEDLQQQVFVSRYLKKDGYGARKLRLVSLPGGRQAGDQYVREHYPKEVSALRRRSVRSALVVAIDADTKEVHERQAALEVQLRDASEPGRRDGEAIVILVPKRNIETWIHYLFGTQVNEDDVYPKLRQRENKCQPAVDRLWELTHSDEDWPKECPPSLTTCRDELTRLP